MITGKALLSPLYQRFLPVVLLPSGVLAGYYNIERTLFNGEPVAVQLSDTEVLAECVTVGSNNTHVHQYMAVVFYNIQSGHTPWMSKDFVSRMDSKSQFTAHYGSLEKRTSLDVFSSAFLTNLDFDVDNHVSAGDTPPAPDFQEPKVWTVRVGSLFSGSCTYIDINWIQQFLKTSPKAKPQTAAITETPSEFRVNLIATRMGGDGLPIYDTLRIQNKVPATLPVQIKLLVDSKTEVTINIV